MNSVTPDGWTFEAWCGEVWERGLAFPVSSLPGDRAVHAVATFQGMGFNGGLLHAVLSEIEEGTLDTTVEHLRWCGLDAVADAALEVRRRVEAADEARGSAGIGWVPRVLGVLGVRAPRRADEGSMEDVERWAGDAVPEFFNHDRDVVGTGLARRLRESPEAFAPPTDDNASGARDEDDDGGPSTGSALRAMARRGLRLAGRDTSIVTGESTTEEVLEILASLER